MYAKEKKQISVGVDDFKKLIEENFYFVDKSLFIKNILDSRAVTTLIPRPRRFGKTLNLSMLRYFFEKSDTSNRHLFNKLEIEKHPRYMEHQGQHPVVWMSFKDVKVGTWDICYRETQEVIVNEFARHNYLLNSPALNIVQKRNFAAIMDKSADQTLFHRALLILSDCLATHHGKPTIILIDEYDSPIHEGYVKGYYQEIISFMRIFLGAGLKGNEALKMGVLTGILRVAKESIFSGLNNLFISSLTDTTFDDKFGLLENEVTEILRYFGLENNIDTVREWYDGYQSGLHKIYNPWSIVSLIKYKGALRPYWVNTSDNALIKELLKKASATTKEELEVLIAGGKLTKAIQENIIMTDIANEETLWNFLLFCGYLTFENYEVESQSNLAELSIPNKEVRESYITSFRNWFGTIVDTNVYNSMLKSLITGDIDNFREFFERLVLETLSSFDVGGEEPERFYHALVLGMLSSLFETHLVKSNRESGMGRYDIMLIPKNKTKLGIIIEFKKVRTRLNETLESEAKKALQQIEAKNYEAELRALGIEKILKLGISFLGKNSLILVG